MRPYFRRLSGGLLAVGAIAFGGIPTSDQRNVSPDDDALFAATVATLADSLHAIQKMIGGGAHVLRIGIDPRPMCVADDAGGDPLMTAPGPVRSRAGARRRNRGNAPDIARGESRGHHFRDASL